MLSNIAIDTVLSKLQSAPFELHLTGSHYFGNHVKSSDYDFFCEYTEENAKYLYQLNFMSISKSHYGDSNCKLVLRQYDNLLGQIDIQMVRDVKMKIFVQKILKQMKIDPAQHDWDIAFEIYKAMIQQKELGVLTE